MFYAAHSFYFFFFFFNDTATTEIYTLHIVGSVRCVQETGINAEYMGDQRIMCSVCAVKNHDHKHRLEDLEKLLQQGIFESLIGPSAPQTENEPEMPSDAKNTSQSPQEVQFFEKIKLQIEKMLSCFTKAKTTITNQLSTLKAENKTKEQKNRQNFSELQNNLSKYKENFISSQQLTAELEKAVHFLYEEYWDDNSKLMRSKNEQIELNLNKKISLISALQEHYTKFIEMVFNNKFFSDLNKLIDIQVSTIQQESQPSIMNENKFLEFIDNKWKQDYKLIEENLQKQLEQLSQALRHTLLQSQREDNSDISVSKENISTFVVERINPKVQYLNNNGLALSKGKQYTLPHSHKVSDFQSNSHYKGKFHLMEQNAVFNSNSHASGNRNNQLNNQNNNNNANNKSVNGDPVVRELNFGQQVETKTQSNDYTAIFNQALQKVCIQDTKQFDNQKIVYEINMNAEIGSPFRVIQKIQKQQ
eukprot:TRINITY_DN846_c0_g1_i1.p1 TRINITY_DN846_c0_g1~~TRINITY_DN846_c0_g1_i1.p1  ORF type:complete len:475 (-),score=104.23 TRINITY_DN846_c0_g1_i1:426-1850(-)